MFPREGTAAQRDGLPARETEIPGSIPAEFSVCPSHKRSNGNDKEQPYKVHHIRNVSIMKVYSILQSA